MERRFDVSKSGKGKLSAFFRKKLKLSDQHNNGIKVKYTVHVTVLLESSQTFEHYCGYLSKDCGEPHSSTMFSGFSVEDLAQWVVQYRHLSPDMTKDKILIDYDNVLKLARNHYLANIWPLKCNFLTCLTDMLRMERYHFNPQMLKNSHFLHRDRVEAAWSIVTQENLLEVSRNDVKMLFFGPCMER